MRGHILEESTHESINQTADAKQGVTYPEFPL